MKSRLNNLAENNLVQRISRIEQDFDDLKNNQAFGSTSVTLQRVATGNLVDFSITCTYHTINCFEITYTPTGFVLPNTCYVWHMFVQGSSTGTGSFVNFIELNRIVASTGAWVFRFYVQGTSSTATITLNMQVVFYAMTQGTISVSQIL